ncbi:bis(5'-adenosyl)-triphosphatase NDAI_0C04190 [Naumovozyma dairenensis CBS 421]|uniref:Bis(5'-adenosyl)-triphosphatase n=1 Tax=Naumovozyma dairenensis (strain ATCC 10597 / BCRC 20456 / CBS 421 / NBRC 0211 / NRRL Y-12639) TaxID=1071378 RepID=G0W8G8_NAUDC|nr:hypothetical protein NDAI_0C04190 [Naumovozyma dairenensis CBS 421]CCD24079.1 hypothetical protein NDAI_0C04190 [Naumovozyma dairenensis CBS 421]
MLLREMTAKPIYFSKFLVTGQVFYKSKYSYALVNLRPIVPGHVLVVPLRTTAYELNDLTLEESQDYFRTVQLIHGFIKWHYKADSLNISIQDGPEAGQSVPHLHTHIIPRYRLNNCGDLIYEKIDDWTFDEIWEKKRMEYLGLGGRNQRKQAMKPDDQRVNQTKQAMFEESKELRLAFETYLEENPKWKAWL